MSRVLTVATRGSDLAMTQTRHVIATLKRVHPDLEVRIRAAQFRSRSKNTPFDGWELRGGVAATLIAGRAVYVNPAAALDLATAIVGPKLPLSGEQMRLTSEFLWFDSSKAQRELSLPHTPVRTALQECYDWYKANGYL